MALAWPVPPERGSAWMFAAFHLEVDRSRSDRRLTSRPRNPHTGSAAFVMGGVWTPVLVREH